MKGSLKGPSLEGLSDRCVLQLGIQLIGLRAWARLRRLGHVRLIGPGFKFEGSGLLQLLSLLGSVVFMLGPQCAVFSSFVETVLHGPW